MALNNAKIITVTSVKGGTGKSTTVLNLAGILSDMGKRTIVIDLDLYSGVIGASLNLKAESDIYTLCEDFINNRFDSFDDYVVKFNDYIDVLPSPIDPRSASKIKTKYISMIIARLKLQYDVILIDTSHILAEINLVTLDLSDEVLYVITNDLMDLKNMKTMCSIYKNMDIHNYRIILNEARLNNTGYSVSDVKNILGENTIYVLPRSFYNKSIEKYVYDGKIMTLEKGIMKSKGGLVLRDILEKIME